MNPKSKKLKIFLSLAILLSTGIIFASFIAYRASIDEPETLISAIQNKANLAIKNFHYTTHRLGIKAWNIDAGKALQTGEGKNAVFQLEDISATYFAKQGGKIFLSAKQGIFSIKSNNLEVSGDVLIKNETFDIKTQKLHYKYNDNIIFAKTPVEITGNSILITADSISIDLTTKRTILEGNIKSTFSNSFAL